MKQNNLMNKPQSIFNCDESGINSHVQTGEKCYSIVGEACYQEKVNAMNLDNLFILHSTFSTESMVNLGN